MCPFIALNGEGLPAQALKGQRQEGCGPSGKCVGGGRGDEEVMGIPSDPQLMGWAEAHPIPTLLSAVMGQEVTALTPALGSKRKPREGRSRSW